MGVQVFNDEATVVRMKHDGSGAGLGRYGWAADPGRDSIPSSRTDHNGDPWGQQRGVRNDASSGYSASGCCFRRSATHSCSSASARGRVYEPKTALLAEGTPQVGPVRRLFVVATRT